MVVTSALKVWGVRATRLKVGTVHCGISGRLMLTKKNKNSRGDGICMHMDRISHMQQPLNNHRSIAAVCQYLSMLINILDDWPIIKIAVLYCRYSTIPHQWFTVHSQIKTGRYNTEVTYEVVSSVDETTYEAHPAYILIIISSTRT